MRELYRNADNVPDSGFAFDNEAFAASLERIYRQTFDPKTEIDRGLFDAILKTLNDGIEIGFTSVAGDRYQDFLNALKTNDNVFAAFKVHRMTNDMAAQLLDENGELKSFAKFKEDVASIREHQVDRWLRTEYDTAVKRAHGAAEWKQFEREKEILPNLRWEESTSVEPRAEHKVFWGHIWPIDDPFWSKHRPGDSWGCKCSLSSTDDPPTNNASVDASREKPDPGLAGNPGVTAKIFSDDHPYIANAHRGARKAVANLLRDLQITKEVITERKFKSGGVLQIPKGLRQNPIEEAKNLKAYTELAKMHGERYKLLNVVDEMNRKNPDAYNLRTGNYSDMKAPVTANGKNAIQTSIKSASKQKVGEVYIYLEREYPAIEIYQGLIVALRPGRAKSLQTVIIRFHNGSLRRYDVAQFRQWVWK